MESERGKIWGNGKNGALGFGLFRRLLLLLLLLFFFCPVDVVGCAGGMGVCACKFPEA